MGKKVLLMGKSGSGKTSMRSLIFSNYVPIDTVPIGPTIDVEQTYIKFLGSLRINMWDCGGQDVFMESYFMADRITIFKNVAALIYVFEVNSKEIDKDINYFLCCLESLVTHSPNAKVFCLIHKMDLVPVDERLDTYNHMKIAINEYSKQLMETKFFQTSIWDDTLYKAWSHVVQDLIPNAMSLDKNLSDFADVIEADEILLFEKATFLVVSHCLKKQNNDLKRFERISNIIKHFKLSCNKFDTSFQSIEIKNGNYTIIIDLFTPNTYIMVIISDQRITPALANYNIKYAQKHFESLESSINSQIPCFQG